MLTLEGKRIGRDRVEGLNYYAADSDLVLDCGEVTETPVRINHPDITEKMVPLRHKFAEPWVQEEDLVCETFDGYLILDCVDTDKPALNSSSNLILYLSEGPYEILESGRGGLICV